MQLKSQDLVVRRHGRKWSVGAPGEAMLLTRTRREAEQLAEEAAAVLRKGGAACDIQGPDAPRAQEPRSFRET